MPKQGASTVRMRWLALFLCVVAGQAVSTTGGLTLERLESDQTLADLAVVRELRSGWVDVPEAALRRQPDTSWWRVRLQERSVDTVEAMAEEPWILAFKEAFEAELFAYVAPDYRRQRLATYDSSVTQLGSRHRLALSIPARYLDQPIYLELGLSRAQPIRLSAFPQGHYLAQDATRIRITSALLSAQLLLGLVAAIYAIAMRRYMLLLFSVWVASSVIYLLVMSGEITDLLPDSALLPHAMRINSFAINVGMVSAYGFMWWFLAIPMHYPRLARLYGALLASCLLLLMSLLVFPASVLLGTLNNLITISLGTLALGIGVARARAGSPQGWFFLIGWGVMSLFGLYRAARYLGQSGTPDWLEIAHPAASTFGALVLVLATARAARYAEREMHTARVVARTDRLTGLANRRQLDLDLDASLLQSSDSGQPLCLMFLDLDRFKTINDRYGHAIGDDCLTVAARICKAHVRGSDLLARYGGEEFVLVLPGAELEQAFEIGESLRIAVESECKEVAGRPIGLTVSIGVAQNRPGESAAELLARADAALYRAKQAGRNCVQRADSQEALPAPTSA